MDYLVFSFLNFFFFSVFINFVESSFTAHSLFQVPIRYKVVLRIWARSHWADSTKRAWFELSSVENFVTWSGDSLKNALGCLHFTKSLHKSKVFLMDLEHFFLALVEIAVRNRLERNSGSFVHVHVFDLVLRFVLAFIGDSSRVPD